MKRGLEHVDLVIAVGVFATVIGGYLMFMASSGTFQPSGTEVVAVERTPTVADAMEWGQPALGQAIVDETILERDMARDLTREVRQLNRVPMTVAGIVMTLPRPAPRMQESEHEAAEGRYRKTA